MTSLSYKIYRSLDKPNIWFYIIIAALPLPFIGWAITQIPIINEMLDDKGVNVVVAVFLSFQIFGSLMFNEKSKYENIFKSK